MICVLYISRDVNALEIVMVNPDTFSPASPPKADGAEQQSRTPLAKYPPHRRVFCFIWIFFIKCVTVQTYYYGFSLGLREAELSENPKGVSLRKVESALGGRNLKQDYDVATWPSG